MALEAMRVMSAPMYLKSITLKGFKSFPDRTRLEFGPGVSVIVGPNGSGKSNITDAVLWALGEQSPLAVRGQSMQDVIFGGAPGRQARQRAEVELVLDDSDGTLGLGVPEVSIVRRLDRAGEGEYRLAGARCRLVDVIEVLSDTGLGKEMHSVISQGRVESIVTSKPRDRRLLIEEAAGLGKHRKRRRRAQLKLARTQDNLDRALDVEREARSRLRPLKRQAEAAELHARLERQTLEARWELARDDLRAQRRRAAAQAQAAAAQARARSARDRAARSRRSASGARRPRRRWPSAAPSARSSRAAARAPSPPASGSAIAPKRSARAASRLERADRRAASRARPRSSARPPADARTRTRHARIAELEQELARARARPRGRAGAPAGRARAAARRGRRRRARAAPRPVEQARACARKAGERSSSGSRAQSARPSARSRRRGARPPASAASWPPCNQFLRSQTAPRAAHRRWPTSSRSTPATSSPSPPRSTAGCGRPCVADRGAAAALLDRAGADGGRALVFGDGERRGASPSPSPHRRRPLSRSPNTFTDPPRPRHWPAVCSPTRGWSTSLDELPECLRRRGGHPVRPGVVGRHARASPGAGGGGGARAGRAQPPRGARSRPARRRSRPSSTPGGARARHRTRSPRPTPVRASGRRRTAPPSTSATRLAESERRLRATIERRRAAPDDGPQAGRRMQVMAELSSARGERERAERERSDRRPGSSACGRRPSVIAR